MTEFLGRSLRCPICSTDFHVEVPVDLRPVAIETDFRPVFEGPDPIAADMIACPICRYAGYAQAFEGGKAEEGEELERPGIPAPLQPLGLPADEELEDLRRWIRRGELVADTDLAAREPSAAERYLLAARCRDYLVDDDLLPLADLYQRGAWCARAAGEKELEQELLAEAVDLLDEALDEGQVATRDRGRLTYLAGEMARRAGDFGAAVDLLGQVPANIELEEEEGLLLYRLARRMAALASVQSDVAARMPEASELEPVSDEDDGAWGAADDDTDD